MPPFGGRSNTRAGESNFSLCLSRPPGAAQAQAAHLGDREEQQSGGRTARLLTWAGNSRGRVLPFPSIAGREEARAGWPRQSGGERPGTGEGPRERAGGRDLAPSPRTSRHYGAPKSRGRSLESGGSPAEGPLVPK